MAKKQGAAALPSCLLLLLLLFASLAAVARAQQPQPAQPQSTEYRRALQPFEAVDVSCPLTVAVTVDSSGGNASDNNSSNFSLAVTASSQDVAQGINATLDNRTLEIDCSNATFASADPIKISVVVGGGATGTPPLRSVSSRGGGTVVVMAAPSSSNPSSTPPTPPNVQPVIQALEQRTNTSDQQPQPSSSSAPPPLVLIASGPGSTLHVRAVPFNVTTLAIAAESGGAVVVRPDNHANNASSSSSPPPPLEQVDVVADDGGAALLSGVSAGLVRVQLGGMARVFVRPPPQNGSSGGVVGGRTTASSSQQQQQPPLRVTGTCSMMARVFLVAPEGETQGVGVGSGGNGGDENQEEPTPYASCEASTAPLIVKVLPWFSGSFLGGGEHSCCAPVSLTEEPQFPEPRWSCGVDLASTGGEEGGCARQQFFKRSSSGQEAGFVSVRVVSPPPGGGRERGRGRGGGCTIVSSGQAPRCSVPDEQLAV